MLCLFFLFSKSRSTRTPFFDFKHPSYNTFGFGNQGLKKKKMMMMKGVLNW